MFEKYSEYKESGVDGGDRRWLGEVPEHWEVKRLKFFAKIQNGQDYKEVEAQEGYNVYGSGGIFKHSTQYLYNGPSVLLGRKGTVDKPLFVNEAFWTVDTMFFTQIEDDVEPKFFYYLCLQIPFNLLQSGSTIPSMTQFDLGNSKLCYPPKSEQTAIANFLDLKTAQIDKAISIKQKQIELLKERRQILIHNAVTRGLDKDVEMKESGVSWIGEIPKYWAVSKLGFYTTSIQTGPFGTQLHSHEYIDHGIAVINPSHIINGEIVPDPSQTISVSKHKELSQHTLNKGDIIFGRRGEMGRCALVKTENNDMICGTGSLKLSLDKSKIFPEFLNIYLKIDVLKEWFSLNSVGSTMENLNSGILSLVPILIPSLADQKKIYNYIEDFTQKIATAISLKEKEIEKLKEYKSILINSAVTGKIKV